MKGWLPLALGLFGVAVGILWTLEGLGQISGSLMSDSPVWAVVGPIVAVAGLAAIILGLRARGNRPS
ncbi:hypothetical protein [Polymorphospora rubra]|uniref:Integral membrane protein n=1 Tax=Polymorphospora rubra TaxID=338584 RepID=A0A810N387_9ACTN|nr:hypothetical protein Prubr_48280 [Polymorphospora rubra]